MNRFLGCCLLVAALSAFEVPAGAAERPRLSLLPTESKPAPLIPVTIVEDPQATEFFQPRADRVREMVARGIQAFTGAPSNEAAWLTLVRTNDLVALKVFSSAGSVAGTRLPVVAAVVEELLAAGLPATNLIVWDKHRDSLERAGFFTLASRYGVRVEGAAEAGYDKGKYYEHALVGRLVLTDQEFGSDGGALGSRRSYVSRLLTGQRLKIISIAPLLSSNAGGTSGHLVGLSLGVVDNTRRFEINGPSLSIAAPEIYVQSDVADQVVLCITDALIAQYLGEEEPRLHYASEPRQLWFSRDPVALDSLALRELARARKNGGVPEVPVNSELYRVASVMLLGVNDLNRMDIKTVR